MPSTSSYATGPSRRGPCRCRSTSEGRSRGGGQMAVPGDLQYTKSHEWVRVEDGVATVGITDHAQDELGDVVFVELPEMGARLAPGDPFAAAERGKGVPDPAQAGLGDVVFVELPEMGATLAPGDSFGAVESVKAVSDLYAPVGGEVVEVNGALEDSPEKINEDPYGEGWILKLQD